jgi:hypothetical protein
MMGEKKISVPAMALSFVVQRMVDAERKKAAQAQLALQEQLGRAVALLEKHKIAFKA